MAMMELNKDTVANEIANSNIAVIEFYSDTCSVCKTLIPVLEELSQKQTKAKFFKINAEQNMQVCMIYRVMSLPTTLIFKNGKLVEKILGFKAKKEMEEILKKAE